MNRYIKRFLDKYLFVIFVVFVMSFCASIPAAIEYIQMSELERHVSSNTVPAPLKRNFYVRSGFRVSDNEIRLSVVTYSRNKETLYWLRDGLAVGRVELVCQGNKCPSDYSRRCALVGYIGIIKSDKPEQLTNTIEITNSFDNNTVSIDLIDRRKPQQLVYGHKLGVCVQPMFLYYDYLELISFIEKWIVAGATKFYFLQESMTSNILKVINYYKNNVAGISVQVIDWPSLPKLTDYHDPNLYIYRLERNLAIMECMYHARYQTKYVAQVHLNQFIISQNHETLLTYLESKSTSHSIASFSFRSVNAILTSKWNSVEDMAKVKFENHFKVKHTRSFERPIYSKLIFRPDYNLNYYIDYPLVTETSPLNSTGKYMHVDVSEDDGIALLLPTNLDHLPLKFEFTSQYYDDKIDLLNINLSRRLPGLINEITPDQDGGIQKEMGNFDKCMKSYHTKKIHLCISVPICEVKISPLIVSKLIRSPNSWFSI